jgi:2-oxoisovalerate dehydrogenase E2 component (dihydrolipoyl transacylase)
MKPSPMADQTFRLPDLGEGLTEAQLVRWRVVEGDRVDVNTALCEVETAKAVVVIPSPWAGTVRTLHGRPGQAIPVGAPLVTILTAGEAPPESPARGILVGYGPDAQSGAQGFRRRARGSSAPAAEPDVRAAPFVRQLARERGVDLARVIGSGPGGRITRADVEAAGTMSTVGSGQPSATPRSAATGDQRISVVGIRKAIARQMVRSVSTIPQFTEFALFDATALTSARALTRQSGKPLTPLPYFIRALAQAVKAHPLLNSSWDEAAEEIVVKHAIHVGIAVNTPQGLLVPVLRHADQLPLEAVAQQAARLIEGARAATLQPSEMTGGTITLTNVGASGPVETGTPIINPPECCVVGFGGIRPRPMVVDGRVEARESAWISISVDHRIVDGALATDFLTSLVRHLEALDA